MTKATQILSKLATGLMVLAVAYLGLGVVPFTENFVIDSKSYGLLVLGLVFTALFAVTALRDQKMSLVVAPYTSAAVFFGLVALASSFLTNDYPVEHLLGLGGIYIAITLIVIFAPTILPRRSGQSFLTALGVTGALLTLLSALQLVGFGPAQVLNRMMVFEIPTDFLFNVSGSAFIAFQVVLVGLVGLIAHTLYRGSISKVATILIPILVIGLGLFGWHILPGKETAPLLPSYNASWSVALDTIRLPRAAMIGAGPAAYPNVYNQFRPVWTNNTEYWEITFNQGAMVPLTTLATMGFLGLLTWGALAWTSSVKSLNQTDAKNKPLVWMIFVMVGLQLIFPSNLVMLGLWGLAMAALAASLKDNLPMVRLQTMSLGMISPRLSTSQAYGDNQAQDNNYQAANQTTNQSSRAGTLSSLSIVGVLLLLLSVFGSYLVGRAYAAQVASYQASQAAFRDDLIGVYAKQQQAVNLNPYSDILRRNYATTNLMIAFALSDQPEPTELEQVQIAQLLQQAIREARSATILDPRDTQNWQVLANIYQNLIPVEGEAGQWALQAYVSAIETNPINPNLRIALGGLFLEEEPEQAVNIFFQAIDLKPDFANTYYNLAQALIRLDQLFEARAQYQQVLALLDSTSEDYVLVTQELEELENQLRERFGDDFEAVLRGELDPAELEPGEPMLPGEDELMLDDETNGIGPSILEQNIEDSGSVVRQPSTGELQDIRLDED